RQQPGALRECVDEGAFARLDLADDGDAAGALIQLGSGGIEQGRCMLAQQSAEPPNQVTQLYANSFQRRPDGLCLGPGEAQRLPAPWCHQSRRFKAHVDRFPRDVRPRPPLQQMAPARVGWRLSPSWKGGPPVAPKGVSWTISVNILRQSRLTLTSE